MGKYTDKKAIASYPICNAAAVVILDINDNFVVSAFAGETIKHARKTKLFYDYKNENYYFVRFGCKYFINDFMRL